MRDSSPGRQNVASDSTNQPVDCQRQVQRGEMAEQMARLQQDAAVTRTARLWQAAGHLYQQACYH